MNDPKKQGKLLDLVQAKGGLGPGVAKAVADETGVPEAEVFGAASFFHLLEDTAHPLRVCTGLSCAMRGSREVLAAAIAAGLPAAGCSCLAACDRAPAVLRDREVLVEVAAADISNAAGDWRSLSSAAEPSLDWRGAIGHGALAEDQLAIGLHRERDHRGLAFARAQALGPEAIIDEIAAAGLQGRGGAGFPAAIKWRGVRMQASTPRYIVLNADEGEPGTFKDREVMLRRPDVVLEGLAIAAFALGVDDVYLYLRGEFQAPWRSLLASMEAFAASGGLGQVRFHLHAGHGAYICGEETALLEALEGKRGMPRLKPPFPTEKGLWGQPTLIQNVETIACVPAIVQNGGSWFKALGKTEAGTKLYSISGDVARPGTYELPLGVSLDDLVAAAGGYKGKLRAFSPGGASSGFLPATERTRPLDFRALAEVGSMLGSAGVVVINEEADLLAATREQLVFFEAESCGQCAPCRIGTRFVREAFDRFAAARRRGEPGAQAALAQLEDVAFEMVEGSICGLGQTAPLPVTSLVRHFPEELVDG